VWKAGRGFCKSVQPARVHTREGLRAQLRSFSPWLPRHSWAALVVKKKKKKLRQLRSGTQAAPTCGHWPARPRGRRVSPARCSPAGRFAVFLDTEVLQNRVRNGSGLGNAAKTWNCFKANGSAAWGAGKELKGRVGLSFNHPVSDRAAVPSGVGATGSPPGRQE
jgi:hypothetical protein